MTDVQVLGYRATRNPSLSISLTAAVPDDKLHPMHFDDQEQAT